METCITHSHACIRRRTCISRASVGKSLARRALPSSPRRLQCVVSSGDFESENPQNVPAPLRVPSPELSAVDAVRVQLEAAKDNNTPRPDHGVHVLYEFCADAGSMERSRYFGFSKDLYHLDHFLSIKATYKDLFDFDELIEVAQDNANNLPEDMARVRARIARGDSKYIQ